MRDMPVVTIIEGMRRVLKTRPLMRPRTNPVRMGTTTTENQPAWGIRAIDISSDRMIIEPMEKSNSPWTTTK